MYVCIIVKSRLQLLECNSFLHLYYPQAYQNACPLCNNCSDTVSHILNGCMSFRNMHIRRHDRIVNHIHHQLINHQPDFIADVPFSFSWCNIWMMLQKSYHPISSWSFVFEGLNYLYLYQYSMPEQCPSLLLC